MDKLLTMLDNLEEIRQIVVEEQKKYTLKKVIKLCRSEIRTYLQVDGGIGWTEEMEQIKEKALANPANYPLDYTIRIYQAIVAEFGGFAGRTDWTSKLKANPSSKYATRMREGTFHI